MTDAELIATMLTAGSDGRAEKLFLRVKRVLNGENMPDAATAVAMVLASLRSDVEDDADLLLRSILALMRRIEALRVEQENAQ